MPFSLHTSNRMECLLDELAAVVTPPPVSPFTPETIVVQSRGMERWLAMELARRFGVWANACYPFPNAFAGEMFRRVLPQLPEVSPFEPEVLAWRVMGLLPSCLGTPGFEPLTRYLAQDHIGVKRFQLARRIADTFDQYTLFRPDLIAEWEQGRGDGWQALLWRKLAGEGRGTHRDTVRRRFRDLMTSEFLDRGEIPGRISVFGISYLPPFHLEILSLLSHHAAVHLFILSPCREYWGDIVPARDRGRYGDEGDHREEGNPLLASLGKLGRDFQNLIIEAEPTVSTGSERYVEPGDGTLLGAVQSDILNLRGGDREGPVYRPERFHIQVHSCHSPLREIEVLNDQLMAYFAADRTLTPRDILVMTPEIDTYAPCIAAVFGGGADGVRIPWSLADRGLRGEGRLPDTLLKLVSLAGSRFEASRLLDILEVAEIRTRFGLDGSALETIRAWMEATGIRWGVDGEHRRRHGMPVYDDNTWRQGLDRLLLGYALPGDGTRLWEGMLPHDAVEGEQARILGRFVEFFERLVAAVERLELPHSLTGWLQECRRLMDEFFPVEGDAERERAAIDAVLSDLDRCQELSGFDEDLGVTSFRLWLEARLGKEERGGGFLSGGVTFCAMLPMRSIPFRVIAMVGMNDGAFPRQSRPPGFDLMAAEPRPGDRSLRDEDRYLFLEALLSARDRLYLSYVGQSIRDNSELPPSVLVSELLDLLATRYRVEGGDMRDLLVTKHRLQAFSPDYFSGGGRLFSFSAENAEALRQRRTGGGASPLFLGQPLELPPGEELVVPLAVLLRFFDNPSRHFLNNRLGVRFEETATPLDDREPFGVDRLDEYTLTAELVETVLANGRPEDHLPLARARGILPPARHGEILFGRYCTVATDFAREVQTVIGDGPLLPPLDFVIPCNGVMVTGRLEGVRSGGLVRYRCAGLKGKDRLRTWIEHLVLNCLAREGYPLASTLLMKNGRRNYRPVAAPGTCLAQVVSCYREGLTRPLPYFPRSSMAYADSGWNMAKALAAWDDQEFADGNDPYIELAFRNGDPFSWEFDRVARLILEPLLEHEERG